VKARIQERAAAVLTWLGGWLNEMGLELLKIASRLTGTGHELRGWKE